MTKYAPLYVFGYCSSIPTLRSRLRCHQPWILRFNIFLLKSSGLGEDRIHDPWSKRQISYPLRHDSFLKSNCKVLVQSWSSEFDRFFFVVHHILMPNFTFHLKFGIKMWWTTKKNYRTRMTVTVSKVRILKLCPLAILMPRKENPFIVPHLKALISG